MLETFFTIPNQIHGWPVFGAGLLLAAWAVFSLALLGWLAWRQGFNADTLSYVPLLVIMAAVIVWVLPRLCDARGFPIHGYGVMLLLAVLSATWLAAWRARQIGLHPDAVITMVFWMFVPGIIGARLFYVVEYWSDFQRPSLWETLGRILNVSQGGLVVYGSYLAGFLGLLAFTRRYRVPLLAMTDLVAPSCALGLAIGRIGCLLHGCCFGGLCDLPWAVAFPRQSPPYERQVERGQFYGFDLRADSQGRPTIGRVWPGSAAEKQGLHVGDTITEINNEKLASAAAGQAALKEAFEHEKTLQLDLADGRQVLLPRLAPLARSLPVHPSQIYGTINGLVLCLLLLAYAPFRRRDGELTAFVVTIYPITRFLEEIIRTDEAPIRGTGMTISQNVSLLVFLAGLSVWFYLSRRPLGTAAWKSAPLSQS